MGSIFGTTESHADSPPRISDEAVQGHPVSAGFPACCGDLGLVLPDGTVDAECSAHCVNETQCRSEGKGDLLLPADPNPSHQVA